MSSQIPMNLNRSRTSAKTTTTCLFSLFISFYILSSYSDRTTGWSVLYLTVLPLLGAFLLAALIIVAARATIVAWITVLVLLAFAGKRRRVLVTQGRKITTDVAIYLVKVVLTERGLVAFGCASATILSFMALSCFRITDA